MKFAEHLSAHITPEWRKQYIQYEVFKEILYEALDQAPPAEDADETELARYFAKFDERFFVMCDKELTKVNTFFSEKIAEANRKYASLKSELGEIEEARANKEVRGTTALRRRLRNFGAVGSSKLDDGSEPLVHSHRKMHDLKLAFSEFYLSLVLLQNYQSLNHTGFRKILKKHDKLMNNNKGGKWHAANVDTAPFYTNKDINRLIEGTENLFTTRLEGGDRQKAMKRLRVPPLSERQSPWTTFRVGLFAGVFIVLFAALIISGVFVGPSGQDWRPALRMYRGMFMLILLMALLSVNTYGWRSSGVNHVLIFELDPRSHLSHQEMLEIAGILSVVWCLSVLGYLFSPLLQVPWQCQPLALAIFFLVFLFNPTHTLYYKARIWLLRILFRIVTAPFHHVNFADFWLADQLNSLVLSMLDFQYIACYYFVDVDWWDGTRGGSGEAVCHTNKYGIRPIIAVLPAWFRFAQCMRRYFDTRHAFPHLVNAGKYSTTFFVVLFSTLTSVYESQSGSPAAENVYFWLWIVCGLASSTYTFLWDIKMDWGLFDKNAGENRFLREEIVYAHKTYYYFAIVEDFLLRLAWVVGISLGEYGLNLYPGEIIRSVLGPLEVFRRFIWNFFRLENEHLNNCGEFRAVRDISIAPVTTSDQALVERMMDEEDGVTHRRLDRMRGPKDKQPLLVNFKGASLDKSRMQGEPMDV